MFSWALLAYDKDLCVLAKNSCMNLLNNMQLL